ncbi:MAG: molybdopterin-dependent oxidoreductase [Rhodospirillales bacterium]
MLDDELEGEFILGWPDRKRLKHMTSTDAEGRVVYARSPILEQEGLITPVDAFFVNAQVQMPEPTHPDDWSVEICGEVEKPFTLTLDELKKFPAKTVRAVTECAGNDGDFFDYVDKRTNDKPQLMRGGVDIDGFVKKYKERNATVEELMARPHGTNLCSGGEWTGTPLKAILDRAGLKDTAVSVRLMGWDVGVPNTMKLHRAAGSMDIEVPKPDPMNFDKALPMDKALHEDTIIAWAHNGDALRHVHGAPARCVVPGWAGNWWVKWLERIEVHDYMVPCYHQTEYFVLGKSHDDPNKTMCKQLGCKSVITWPRDFDGPIKTGEHLVRGLAWSGEGAITRVEISLDGGKTWQDAHVEYSPDRWLWKRWSFLWKVDKPGQYSIMARAHDEAGRLQPVTEWNWLKKHFDGIVPSDIEVVE